MCRVWIDRHPFGPGGVVAGRGDQGKSVVKVGHVGPLPADQSPELTIRRGVPNRVFRQGQTVHVLDLVVVHLATHYAVVPGLQEGGFVHEDLVLAAGSLVPVMDRQDLHRAQITILAIFVGVPEDHAIR